MFGYVRPVKAELKIKDFKGYKALYCALCHSLGDHYGHFSRLFLSYDFVYLAMLLTDESQRPCFARKRCLMSPIRKKCCCTDSQELKLCAGLSVILTYWKIQDSISDEKGFKRLAARFLAVGLKRAYRKAAGEYPAYDALVKSCLTELSELEKAKCSSIDRTADTFARILQGAAQFESAADRKRILQQILYQTGRWIYLADAVNDLKEDFAEHHYNPVSEKYGLQVDVLNETQKEELSATLHLSMNSIASAYQLLPPNAWRDVLQNIIYLGFAEVTDGILSGRFQIMKKSVVFRAAAGEQYE